MKTILLRIFLAVLSIIACIFVSFAMTSAIATKGVGSSEVAGWIQAIGSIAAIIGAFAIANNQQQQERHLDSERRNTEEKQRIAILEALFMRAESIINGVRKEREDSEFGLAKAISVERLRASGSLFATLPLFEIPDGNLALTCHEAYVQIDKLCDELLEEATVTVSMRPIQREKVKDAFANANLPLGVGRVLCNLAVEKRGGLPISS